MSFIYFKVKKLLESEQDEIEASDVNTPPERLHQLAELDHPNKQVHVNLASNPAASAKTLELLHNKSIKSPDKEYEKVLKQALLKNPSTPLPILKKYFLSGHHEDLMENPIIPLMQLEDPSLSGLVGNNQYTKDLAEITEHPILLQALAQHSDPEVRANVVNNRNTPDDVFNYLTQDAAPRVHQALVYKSKTPKDVIRRLSDSSDVSTIRGIAHRKDLEPEIYEKLMNHPDIHVKRFLASNKTTPSHVLDQMAGKEDHSVLLSNIAGNPNASPQTLHQMAMDILKNRNWSSLRKLSNIVENPSTSLETLQQISQMSDPNGEFGDIASNAAYKLGNLQAR